MKTPCPHYNDRAAAKAIAEVGAFTASTEAGWTAPLLMQIGRCWGLLQLWMPASSQCRVMPDPAGIRMVRWGKQKGGGDEDSLCVAMRHTAPLQLHQPGLSGGAPL